MLERNLLSHLKLGVLLSLLSASIFLRTRLISEPGETDPIPDHTQAAPLLATVQSVAALAALVAGYWQYHSHYRDLYYSRAFLVNNKYVADFCRYLHLSRLLQTSFSDHDSSSRGHINYQHCPSCR